jgi:cell division protein FtsQ
VRPDNLFSKRGTAVLDAPEPDRASTPPLKRRRADAAELPPRRDYAPGGNFDDDYAEGYGRESDFSRGARRSGLRLSLSGRLIPSTLWGRIAAGVGLMAFAGAGVAGALAVRSYLLHDPHFTVAGSGSIQIAGNSHLSRAQLLSVFGGDVERNIFRIPLDERRAELEALPWVAHATVMRLLPNRVRVAIVERTPVAFVRDGSEIGLVDANGVLLNLPDPSESGNAAPAATLHYSFPVVTGISVADPLSTRAARMKIYAEFLAALDANGETISQRISEVDISNPEDVRAIIPDNPSGHSLDLLVHFGDEKFLERYHQYQEHLAEWRAQYPRLASVDMRYERQVVLQMQPSASAAAPTAAAAPATIAPARAAAPVSATAMKPGQLAPTKPAAQGTAR